ncbi:Uncharacterised protein [Pantoea agglomerans]|uniref:Uncharacterized protein n=1 Tax=Enterobacter agglomerans TaxID=549 RepID=A0A379AFF6_ENTAG|nr:Uncharacterised protein [Pantoea agglomerans]
MNNLEMMKESVNVAQKGISVEANVLGVGLSVFRGRFTVYYSCSIMNDFLCGFRQGFSSEPFA